MNRYDIFGLAAICLMVLTAASNRTARLDRLNFLSHRWNALILYHLSLGPKRFGEIEDCLPTVGPKVLTERIVALERYRLIERPTRSRGELYSLSPRGSELMPILNLLEV
ncbi:winged helix-turn-helix transcriptional regulator [Novosphingopyxis sp.]|uniref:winged helix-turn-helix transcriptional regulator n=1 Tax=Novosphingopyxis sp. TaxID=2709690 RepID=UPI003B599F65